MRQANTSQRLAVSSNGTNTVVYYSPDGLQWQFLLQSKVGNASDVAVLPNGNVLIASTNAGLFGNDTKIPLVPGASIKPPNPLFPQETMPNADWFPETAHYLPEPFRGYWNGHGGLAQFGYPITEAFDEISNEDGQVYQTQYFQRARLEYHAE